MKQKYGKMFEEEEKKRKELADQRIAANLKKKQKDAEMKLEYSPTNWEENEEVLAVQLHGEEARFRDMMDGLVFRSKKQPKPDGIFQLRIRP